MASCAPKYSSNEGVATSIKDALGADLVCVSEANGEIAVHVGAADLLGCLIALGCGSPAEVDGEILKKVANVVLMMDNVSADQIAKFFQWVSQSVATASK